MPGDRLPKPQGCGISYLFGRPCPGHGPGCPWHEYWRRASQKPVTREAAIFGCHREFPDGLLLGVNGLVQPVPVTRPRERYPSPEGLR